ncbi:MAG: metallophosphoesterase [Actinomycetota bacterium]|nr:metallophosphoesterase [Actinomycetota bacterium]
MTPRTPRTVDYPDFLRGGDGTQVERKVDTRLMGARNKEMVRRIEIAPIQDPFTFVIAGESGAWPDPTAEGIFGAILEQVSRLDPQPRFFVNLGDFAGPGTPVRHRRYLQAIRRLPFPNLCILGNHELDDHAGLDTYRDVHGASNFVFSYGTTDFIALRSVPGSVGEMDIPLYGPGAGRGPHDEDIEFLEEALQAGSGAVKVILMHMPPNFDGHYAPHAEWGFTYREGDFLELMRDYEVDLVCCAHGLAFDTVVINGTRFVMSGGGGTGLCSDRRGVCSQGPGRPEERGALFHAVEVTVRGSEATVSGRVLQAFASPWDRSPITF